METDQLGWTEAQWNRVREEVFNAWQRVRVAASFLPVYSSLPASTKIVPSEVFRRNGSIDTAATAYLLEIALPVTLTRQEVRDENLSSALLQFTRRAMQVGQLEDWFIFNGIAAGAAFPSQPKIKYTPDIAFAKGKGVVQGLPTPIADPATQIKGLRRWNPGALGLYYSPKDRSRLTAGKPDSSVLMETVVDAINALDREGYVGPHVCVFAQAPYTAAYSPKPTSLVLPRDRIEPIIGRELLHASALDIAPRGAKPSTTKGWRSRGVLLSLAGDAIDLAVAAEATAEFRQVNAAGRYVFAVFERFALRVKDPKAIVPLQFAP